MNKILINFYNEYVANGSNIAETAKTNGITNAQCFKLSQYGQELKEEEDKK